MAKQYKIGMDESQKKSIETQVQILQQNFKATQVRIPGRIEDISLKWLRDAPFYAEFLLKFNYYTTKGVPTIGVNARKGFINLYMNDQFVNGGLDEEGKALMMPKIDKKTNKPVFVLDKNGQPTFDEHGDPVMEMEEWKGLNDQELEGVLIHEIMHLIRCHHERSREDHYVWNIAGDMLINDDIKGMTIGGRKIALPDGGVYLDMARQEGYKGEKITEPLYEWLLDIRKQFQNMLSDLIKNGGGQSQGQNQQGQGQQQDCKECGGDGKEKDENGNETGNPCPHCGGTGKEPGRQGQGQGSGGKGQNKSGLFDAIFGSKIDYHEIMEDNDGLAESTIKEIVDTAKIKGYGTISGNMVETLEKLTKPSRTSWKQILRKHLSAVINSPGPFQENSWARKNRRGLPLPGNKKLDAKIGVAIDTSGSIGTAELTQFFTEIEKIVKDISQICMIQCDAEIQDVHPKYKKGDFRKIKIKGRGGTVVQPVFDWMFKNKMEKYPLVYFTDGDFCYDFDTKGVKVYWCISSTGGYRDSVTVPKGDNIHIDIKENER